MIATVPLKVVAAISLALILSSSPISFVDTGLLDNDGITSNGVITINNLELNATWQYSISGDNGFVDGTNRLFCLIACNIGSNNGNCVVIMRCCLYCVVS
jgi:hypothetical protein